MVIAIESETDDLPIGKVRSEWDEHALAEKYGEIERCEALWRESMKGACERILLRTRPVQ